MRPRHRAAGVVTVDGRMIENLHVEEARRVLAVVGRGRRTLSRVAEYRPYGAAVRHRTGP